MIKEINLTEIYRLLFFWFRVKVRPKGQGGRHGELMVSVLDSGSSGPGSSPSWGHCVVFLGKTIILILRVPTYAQVYKWVPANLSWGEKKY